LHMVYLFGFFFFQAEDGIRDRNVTGVQTCALPIYWVNTTYVLSTSGLSTLIAINPGVFSIARALFKKRSSKADLPSSAIGILFKTMVPRFCNSPFSSIGS